MSLQLNTEDWQHVLAFKKVLNTHGYVSVPHVGGFMLYKSSAHMHRQDKRFTPPTQKIRFSSSDASLDPNLVLTYKQLTKQDALEAQKSIYRWGKDIKSNLSDVGGFHFKELGALKKEGDSLTFSSSFHGANKNLLDHTYGLPVLKLPSPLTQTNRSKAKVPFAFLSKAAVLFLLIFNLLLLSLLFQYNAPEIKASLLNTFSIESPQASTYQYKPMDSFLQNTTALDTPISKKELTLFIDALSVTEPNLNSIKTNTVELYDAKQSYLIEGCFKHQHNAQKRMQQLLVKGYKAGFFKHKGLFKVYCEKGKRDLLVNQLRHFQENLNTQIWVLGN